MNTQPYPTDLTDSQWSIIQELIPAAKPGGRPRSLDMRLVINAILYVVVGGIQWRMLPREYPKWYSVYHYFQRWRDDGSWQRIHDTLRAQVRQRAGRHKHPTGGCLDSQSVKTTAVPGNRGFDKAKLINGRKRHILVDTTGLLMAVVVTAGSVQDPAGPAALGSAGRRRQETAPDLGRRRLPRPTACVGRQALSFPAPSRVAPARTQGFHPATKALGGGTHLCLAQPVSAPQQGL